MTVTESRTDEQRVIDLVDELLREYPPATTDTVDVPRRAVRPGPRLGPLPGGPRRSRPVAPSCSASSTSGSARPAARTRTTANPIGYGMCGPTIVEWGTDEQKQPLPATAVHRRGHLVPALLRAGCRLRRRRAVDDRASATATSGSSTVRRCGPRSAHISRGGACSSRAPTRRSPKHARPHRLRGRHARARRRGAAAAPDDRRGRVQRGLLHRRRASRRRDRSGTPATAGGCRSRR